MKAAEARRSRAMRAFGRIMGERPARDGVATIVLQGQIGEPDKRGRIITAGEVEARLAVHAGADRIHVVIDSCGGLLNDAWKIYNLLRRRRPFVSTEVAFGGACASAATLVFLAGKHREAWAGQAFLLHAPSIAPAKNAEKRWTASEHRRAAAELEKANKRLIDEYTARTGASRQIFERQLQNEDYMSYAQALSCGLVHCAVGSAQWLSNRHPSYFPVR